MKNDWFILIALALLVAGVVVYGNASHPIGGGLLSFALIFGLFGVLIRRVSPSTSEDHASTAAE